MVYQWKNSAYIKADANVAGKMCEELERTVGLTAETMLEANRAESAPLHSEFEWDDEIAAEGYRLQQARHIINCLCIRQEDAKKEPIRAFFRVDTASSSYESLDVIIRQEDKYAALLKAAGNELKAFKKKYAALKELEELFKLIDDLEVKE